jgi:hypothetical protein
VAIQVTAAGNMAALILIRPAVGALDGEINVSVSSSPSSGAPPSSLRATAAGGATGLHVCLEALISRKPLEVRSVEVRVDSVVVVVEVTVV